MEVLVSPTEIFDLNQPTSKLIDQKICTFDYSNKDDVDFFFKKISTFISYRYPSAKLKIGDKYTIDIPLNWKIMTTNDHNYECHLVPLEEILHWEVKVPVFNPFYPRMPKLMDVEIQYINPNPVEHFVAKLPKKNILVMPIGNKKQWDTIIYDKHDNVQEVYPDCIFLADDIDQSRFEEDLWNIIG